MNNVRLIWFDHITYSVFLLTLITQVIPGKDSVEINVPRYNPVNNRERFPGILNYRKKDNAGENSG